MKAICMFSACKKPFIFFCMFLTVLLFSKPVNAEVVVHPEDLAVFKEIIHDAGKTLDEFIFLDEFEIKHIESLRKHFGISKRKCSEELALNDF